jgi:hypothetical protein
VSQSRVPRDPNLPPELRRFLDDLARASDVAAGAVQTTRTISAAGIATGGGDLSANRTITVTAALQADQETSTSLTAAVVPGVQQFHPSSAKAWGQFLAAGTIVTSYNVASVVQDSAGDWTVTLDVDMGSANYPIMLSVLAGASITARVVTRAAGSFTIKTVNSATGADLDPTEVMFVVYGDQ